MLPKQINIKPIYWITGNYFDCQKKWQQICSLIGDPNVQIIEAGGVGQASAVDIILALKHKDIFDCRPRILKVKGIPEDYDSLSNYLSLTSDKNVLVFDGLIGYKKPPSQRLISLKVTNLFKKFAQIGEICEFDTVAKNNGVAIQWVTEVVKSYGKEIDTDASRLLIDFQGRDLDKLHADVSKLCDYQNGKKISIEDVKECVPPVFLRQVWDLVDDLCLMKTDECIAHLQSFYDIAGIETGTSFRGDVEMLLGAMLKQFNFYQLVKDRCVDRLDYNAVKTAAVGIKKPKTKNQLKEDDQGDQQYFDQRFISMNLNKETTKSTLRWPWTRLYAATREIHRTRLYLRQSYTTDNYRSHIKLLLDSLIMHICGKLTPKQLEKMRGST